MQDLVAGQIDFAIADRVTSLPQVRAGTIKAYAITGKDRLAAAPDIPTVDEAGLPGFYTSVRYGLWAPKGTPKAIIARLNSAVTEAYADAFPTPIGNQCREKRNRGSPSSAGFTSLTPSVKW
jgi:tripartite-type tricarboxylate transporter receptor subunit TctC